MRPLSPVPLPPSESKAARRRRRLLKFKPPFRRYVAGLSATSLAIEDLADTFPALLFALATGYGRVTDREAAFRAVVDGRPLKEAAAVLGLPFWTRRLSALALTQPLPLLPTDPEFAAEAVNRIPQDPIDCRAWLDRIATALMLLGRDQALWLIREPRLMPPYVGEETFQWILAWCWASVHPPCPGHALLRGAWSASIGAKRAVEEVAIWRKRIDLVGALADPARDPWYVDGKAGGFSFVQLRNVADFIAESVAMDNCLDQYAAHLAYGRVRVFSIRRDGKPVACVELAIRSDQSTEAAISQVRGPRNRRASPAVWNAISAWLAQQGPRPLIFAMTSRAAARAALDAFWGPYLKAVDAAGLTLRLPSAVVASDRVLPNARPARIIPPMPVEDALPEDILPRTLRRAAVGG